MEQPGPQPLLTASPTAKPKASTAAKPIRETANSTASPMSKPTASPTGKLAGTFLLLAILASVAQTLPNIVGFEIFPHDFSAGGGALTDYLGAYGKTDGLDDGQPDALTDVHAYGLTTSPTAKPHDLVKNIYGALDPGRNWNDLLADDLDGALTDYLESYGLSTISALV